MGNEPKPTHEPGKGHRDRTSDNQEAQCHENQVFKRLKQTLHPARQRPRSGKMLAKVLHMYMQHSTTPLLQSQTVRVILCHGQPLVAPVSVVHVRVRLSLRRLLLNVPAHVQKTMV